MPISEDTNRNEYQIQSYRPGKVIINNQMYTQSLIITNQTLTSNWVPTHVNEITQAHIDSILLLQPEVILIGTGAHCIIPPPPRLQAFDCMDTGAACRTFVALSAEGRNVLAALLIDGPEK